MTIGIAIIAKFVLLDYPGSPIKRLSAEERALALARVAHDKQDEGTNGKKLTTWQAFKAAAVDLRMYVFMLMYTTQNAGTSLTYFIPTVLSGMGYRGVTAQWMTVPVWGVGIVLCLLIPTSSDRFRERRWHIVAPLALGVICAIVNASVRGHDKVRYAFICLYVGGVFSTAPNDAKLGIRNTFPSRRKTCRCHSLDKQHWCKLCCLFGLFLAQHRRPDLYQRFCLLYRPCEYIYSYCGIGSYHFPTSPEVPD
ncbi:hypothetical protein LTR93_010838 [Exophiala xenobiotica]|nr:hypothetical protein LTR93_010838 [Exophiala xenobiotica]